jgi:hypothetical protein
MRVGIAAPSPATNRGDLNLCHSSVDAEFSTCDEAAFITSWEACGGGDFFWPG